ncbi:MAG: hypothetical protein RL102_901 [Actinomycetota bacterium]
MKPTKISALAINAIATVVIAYIIVTLMVGAGFAVPVSGINLVLTMPAIGLVNMLLVLPILRYKKALADYLMGVGRSRPKRPEPFYAVRVLTIAKASALAGAWFTGWHAGVVLVQLTNQEFTEAVWREAFGGIGSVLLVVAALIAERSCRLPDDGDDKKQAGSVAEPKPAGPISA